MLTPGSASGESCGGQGSYLSASKPGRSVSGMNAFVHASTAEAAQASLEAERVRKALQTLTPAQRGALELAFFGGYTHTEVAAMLDLPLGTAKTRIRDGLIRLRDTLGLSS